MRPSLRSTLILTAVAATAVTVFVSVGPPRFAYRASAGHVAIETAAALIALLLSYLLLGRFLLSGRPSDGLVAISFGIIGLTNLAFSALPAATGDNIDRFGTWASAGGRLLGALGLALAAFVPDERIRAPRELLKRMVLVFAGGFATMTIAFAIAEPHLPRGIDPGLSPMSAGHPRVVGHPAILAVQLLSALLFAAAAIGFLRRAERTGDRLTGTLAIASVLAVFAHVNYFLFPSLYSEWVYTGDFFRASFYLVLLVGAFLEIQRYQQGIARSAALEERRRLARELHDGLAQELAFIATQTRWLARRSDQPGNVDQLVVAAERALDESRSAISALTRPMDEPLDVAIAQAAEEVAARVGVRLRLDLAGGIEVPVGTRTQLVRIVREAVSNTARHGNASSVTVVLSNGPQASLRVTDDGVGFDPDRGDGPGFGLTSMRERAQALGAQFRVSSSPGEGTEIQVVLP